MKAKLKKRALWLDAAAAAGKPQPRTLREIHEVIKADVRGVKLGKTDKLDHPKNHPWRRGGGGLWPERTTGDAVAATVRTEANRLTPGQRRELERKGRDIIFRKQAEAVAKRKAKALAKYWKPEAVEDRKMRRRILMGNIQQLRQAFAPLSKIADALAAVPKRKPVRRVSAKKAKSDRLYNKMVRRWLAEPKPCAVMRARREPLLDATQCHHKFGRTGTLKFDKRFWIPVSAEGHAWIDANRAKAVVIGLLGGPGEWHVVPDDPETRRIRDWMREKGLV